MFFSINSILFDTCHWIELRLWSDLYLIQGRYTVIMGTPNKTSSLSILNGLDVYPPYMAAHLSYPTGASSLRRVLTSFVMPVHNQGASLAYLQGHALWRKFLPATSSFFVLSLLIQTLRLQHLSVDASCNHYGCSLLLFYAAFSCSPGCRMPSNIFDAS